MKDLQDKIVVITGGTGLIGRQLCQGFAELGSVVIFVSRNAKNGLNLEAELRSKGAKAHYFCLDISDENQVDEFIDQVMKQHGRIDVWINNAWPKTDDWMKGLEEAPVESIRRNIDMHLTGFYLCSQRVSQAMKRSKKGSIINFGSIYGLVGPNFSIYENTQMTCPPAYPLIKGGIVAMTRYFATYFAKDGIRVNCICPGGVFDNQDKEFVQKYEKLVPLGRMGNPEEIVGPALFLASDISSYVTGHCLAVDGGWTAW